MGEDALHSAEGVDTELQLDRGTVEIGGLLVYANFETLTFIKIKFVFITHVE
jgi:hypothetical protein